MRLKMQKFIEAVNGYYERYEDRFDSMTEQNILCDLLTILLNVWNAE